MGVDEERLVIEETFHIPTTVVQNTTKEILHTTAYMWARPFIAQVIKKHFLKNGHLIKNGVLIISNALIFLSDRRLRLL